MPEENNDPTRVFLAGRNENNPNRVKEYQEAQTMLESFGFEVVNPMTLKEKRGADFLDTLHRDLEQLRNCHAIFLLKDTYQELVDENGNVVAMAWRAKSAHICYLVALRLGLQIYSDILTGPGGHED